MLHFLDTLPFDWSRPEAQELRDYLADVYFHDRDVLQFAVQAGIRPATISWSQPVQSVWHELITKARNQGRLRDLLNQIALRDEAVGLRIRELMSSQPVLAAPSDRRPEVSWVGFDDRIGLERQIFSEPSLLDVAFMQRGVELAPAVARLMVTLPSGRYYGTAFRIGDDILLSNHHVLFDRQHREGRNSYMRASRVEAWLYYELDLAGRHRAHEVIECRPETIVGEEGHDWAIVRTVAPLPADVPVIPLASTEQPNINDRVYIIQHPRGGVKKIGMHHNIVRHVDDNVVQYWTDTEAGSSGSPVFDEHWNVVALHHRWIAMPATEGKAAEYRNQGRLISRVYERIIMAGGL
jgi:Trypsin-like peptidase domain/Effector-associated domain 1